MSTQGDSTLVRLFDHESHQPAGERTAVLVVVHGNEIGKRYLINEDALVLGRSPVRATLVIQDQAVSSVHARIDVDRKNNSFGIEDLASRNGTYVNGRKVSTMSLNEGDKIFLGDTILKFTFLDAIEEKYHHKIDQLMNVDSLTGLMVKRPFDLECARAFDDAREERRPLCILMMDMDGLKGLNDQHGHQMGSYCISEVGALIREIVKDHGFACRFGGDEFVACILDSRLADTRTLAEKIRKSVEDHPFCHEGIRVQPTMSIGLAEISEAVKTPAGLLRLADDALYRAKQAGRNAVRC